MKKTLTVISATLMILFIAGCDNTNVSHSQIPGQHQPSTSDTSQTNQDNARTTVDASQNQTETVTFPKLVVEGMTKFASNPLMPLWAPAFVPTPKTEPKTLSVRTWDLGPKNPAYNVQFTQNNPKGDSTPIAGFSGTAYTSTELLKDSFSGVSGLGDPSTLENGMRGTLKTGVINLGYGITGHTYQFDTDQESAKHINHYGSIVWQEGRWKIEVMNSEIDTLPEETAHDVVSYLQTHFLPVPDTDGAIVVNRHPSAQPPESQTMVTWEKGKVIYQTVSYDMSSELSAIEMAVSMHPFP